MMPIRTILCPTDFSDAAEHAVGYARDLAQKLDAKLLLLHVYELFRLALPVEGAVAAPPAWASELSDRWQRMLEDTATRYRGAGVPITTLLRVGRASEEIGRVAEAENVDLIVIGTHGRTGPSRLLLGSVAERVVRSSRVPVLTVSAKGLPDAWKG